MAAKLFDLLDNVPSNVRDDFLRMSKAVRFSPGESIYIQGDAGDALYRLVSGEVRLSVSNSDGRELYYVYLGPGDCFGEVNFVDGLYRPQTAEAICPAELQMLPGCGIQAMLDEHPAFSRSLMGLLANHMRLLIDMYADAGLNDLAGRVARRIISAVPACDRFQLVGRWPVHLSQTDLAHMVGASRQSVNKVLQRFQEERLITTEYGGVVVEAPSLLSKRAFPEGLSAN